MVKIINILAIYSLVVLSIFGNFYRINTGNNIFILMLLLLIPLIAIITVFDYIKNQYLPFLVHSISLALLFHQSFAVNYIFGSDIFYEKDVIDSVLTNSFWNNNLYGNLNSMLSLTLIAPVLFHITGLDIETILRIVYPLVFSFVPLILYMIFSRFMNGKDSFISVFIFMSFWVFFTEILQLGRQMIAELMLALIFYLILKNQNDIRSKLLIIIFSASLITAHYGTSYLFIFLLISAYLMYKLLNGSCEVPISKNYLCYFIILALAWYIFVSSSSPLISIIRIGEHFANSLQESFISNNYQLTDNYQAQLSIGLADTTSFSWQRKIKLVTQYLIQFIITIGILSSIVGKKYRDFFYCMSYIMFLLLIMSISLPVIAGSLNMTRLFHFTLFLLSPFYIIGYKFIFKLINLKNVKISNIISNSVVSLMLILYFMSTTGVLYDITNDTPSSIPLGIEKMKEASYGDRKIAAGFGQIPDETDITSARWLDSRSENRKIKADIFGPHILTGYAKISKFEIKRYWADNSINNYLYLRSFNIKYDIFVTGSSHNKASTSIVSLADYLSNNDDLYKNKIYTSKYSEIYTK